MRVHYPHDDEDDAADDEREPKPFHRCPWPYSQGCRQCQNLEDEE